MVISVNVPESWRTNSPVDGPKTAMSLFQSPSLREPRILGKLEWDPAVLEPVTSCHGRLRIGMSLPLPHWTPPVVPVPEYQKYQVPFEGRNTAMSVLPSPL